MNSVYIIFLSFCRNANFARYPSYSQFDMLPLLIYFQNTSLFIPKFFKINSIKNNKKNVQELVKRVLKNNLL